MRSVTELLTGSREEIDLVYISTTDPILSCALIPAAAYGILQFYKLLLEIAEKQINVFKAVRDLKNSGLGSDKISSISKEMEGMIEREVVKAVDVATQRTAASKIDKERKNEIKIQITKQALEITADIASGARIYVSLESQGQLELIAKAAPEAAIAVDLRQQIEEQKSLEAKLDSLSMSEPIQALISRSIE